MRGEIIFAWLLLVVIMAVGLWNERLAWMMFVPFVLVVAGPPKYSYTRRAVGFVIMSVGLVVFRHFVGPPR